MKQYTISSREILGKALKAARQEKGFTQTKLGNAVGLKQKTVSTVESGSPGVKLETLFRILAGLELTIVLQPHKKNSINAGEW